MLCLSPVTIENPQWNKHLGLSRYIQVPCGRCDACRRNYSLEWSIRLFEESKDWRYWSFLTLTYSPVYLNLVDMFIGDVVHYQNTDIELFSLSKADVKSFLKSFRKRVPKRSFSYFLCGEYGSHTARPHLHCILFYNDFNVLNTFENLWRNTRGITHITRNKKSLLKFNECSSDVQFATSYVAKYACKQSVMPFFYNDKGEWREDFDKPFRLMSKSLGSGYFFTDRFEKLWKKYHSYTNLITDSDLSYNLPNGTVVGLPRYYRDKLIKTKIIDEFNREKSFSPFGDAICMDKVSYSTASNYRAFVAHKRVLDKAQLHQIDKAVGVRKANELVARANLFDEQERLRKCLLDRERDFPKEKF